MFPLSSRKVTLFSFILLLVFLEISLYRFWSFRDLDLHLEANIIADDESLLSFIFSPAIINSTRLLLDIAATSQALIRRSSNFLIAPPLSLSFEPLRNSNASKTLSKSPVWKKAFFFQINLQLIVFQYMLHYKDFSLYKPDVYRTLISICCSS